MRLCQYITLMSEPKHTSITVNLKIIIRGLMTDKEGHKVDKLV